MADTDNRHNLRFCHHTPKGHPAAKDLYSLNHFCLLVWRAAKPRHTSKEMRRAAKPPRAPTKCTCSTELGIAPVMTLLGSRPYVLVTMEDVVEIVLALDRGQAVVVCAVGFAHRACALIAQQVHIQARAGEWGHAGV